ncbi:TetR-like C-terminal domain-containing protein [Agromyces sp. NPDC049794]|uniref:TetR/AcrR family transcriptional regulator n=1 Tax=unclassified Agromyces TaxID=2639701 RepID=UPI0033F3E91D
MPEHEARVDPRAARSRARLAAAVLDLASSRPIGDVTVAELAAIADVNRSTFYQHASSPPALLRSVLTDELDTIRDRYLMASTEPDIRTAVGAVTGAVLEHVQAHRTIYHRGLTAADDGAGLHAMLGSHFEISARMLLEEHRIELPTDSGRAVPLATAARYIAYGIVGAIEAWMEEEPPRPLDELLSDIRLLLPSWWPLG